MAARTKSLNCEGNKRVRTTGWLLYGTQGSHVPYSKEKFLGELQEVNCGGAGGLKAKKRV
jgi:hypothetical protein